MRSRRSPLYNEGRLRHRDIVDQTVAEWIAKRNKNEVLKALVEADVTVAPLYSIADITSDPHFVEREIYSEIPDDDLGKIPVHKPVPDLSDTPATFRNTAPKIGQDTTEILLAAGSKKANTSVLREKYQMKQHLELIKAN